MTIAEFIRRSGSERPEKSKKVQRIISRRSLGSVGTGVPQTVRGDSNKKLKRFRLHSQDSSLENKYVAVRLSDAMLSDDVDKLSKRIRSDPDFAMQLLREAGIATNSGKLSQRYGG